jgi:U3 small nucleolar RNA-associated protein MPP10
MFDFTPLKSLFVDGMDEEQIWAQLDLRTKTICKMLDFVLEGESESQDEVSEGGSEDDDNALQKALEALEGDEDVDMDEFLEKYGLVASDDSEESMEDGEEDEDMGSQSEMSEDGAEGEEGISPLRDSSSDEESGSEQLAFGFSKPILKPAHKKKRNTATSELDDGFFSLAEFNADTERAESKSASRGRLAGDDDSEDDENTIDFFASVDPEENFDEDDLENEGGMYYYTLQIFSPLTVNDSQNYFIVTSSNHHHAHRQLPLQRRQRQSIVIRSDSMMKSA